MLPVKDDLEITRPPVVSLAILITCSLVWIVMLGMGDGAASFYGRYALVPRSFLAGEQPLALFTSIFLHGGWLHVVSNLIFFWIVADNVEDALGHLRFLFLFLLSGAAAGFCQCLAGPDSTVPMVGASGAVGGVLGAFWVLYPKSRIETLFPNPWLLSATVLLWGVVVGLNAAGFANTPLVLGAAFLCAVFLAVLIGAELVRPVYWIFQVIPTFVFVSLFSIAALAFVVAMFLDLVNPLAAAGWIVRLGLIGAFLILLSWALRRMRWLLAVHWKVPAWLFVAIWLAYSFVAGVLWLGGVAAGGVAYWAHVGGILAGILLAVLLSRKVRSPLLRWSLAGGLTLFFVAAIALTYLSFPI